MSEVSVRRAGVAELEELVPLFDRYRQFQHRPSDLPAAREFLRARLDRGESIVFIAHDGAAAVGFAQLYPSFSSVGLARVLVLNDLFVDAAGRRKGVASRLLAALESYAWSSGASSLRLNVVRTNVSAQALYESRGWVRDEQFFMYDRDPQREG